MTDYPGTGHGIYRVAIMGGTFDPIHLGHLVTAEAARVQYGFDQVVFVPSGHPPHKDSAKITPAIHRYVMTILATATNPYFRVSAIEIERRGPSYAVDTVRAFARDYGGRSELFFITGADAIQEILAWKDVHILLELCQFIAATRPGFCLTGLDAIIRQLPPHLAGRIHRVTTPEIDISSTEIRRRIRAQKSIKYLVPESVESYIYKQGLYQDRDAK